MARRAPTGAAAVARCAAAAVRACLAGLLAVVPGRGRGGGSHGCTGGVRSAGWAPWALVLWACLALVLPRHGWAQQERAVLSVDDRASVFDLWPAVEKAVDPAATADWSAMAARGGAFAPPAGPRANLGSERGAVWLRMAVVNRSSDADWVLLLDYPMLQHVDVVVVRQGQAIQRHSLGSRVPVAQRPLPTRAHAMPLTLPRDQRHEVYIRIESSTALLAPLSLLRPAAMLQKTGHEQLLQGLLIGLALALLAYSVFNAMATRQWLFVQYAVMVGASTTFFAAFFGLGPMFLWTAGSPGSDLIAPWSMLVMLIAAAPFVSGALQLRASHPRLHRALIGLSGVAACSLALSLAGVLDYRGTQLISSSLGPLPLVLALPVALQRARHGDGAARWLLLGWGAHLAGALVLLGLLRGLLPATFWTLHAFQLATTLEMVLWVQVLGMRLLAQRRGAERAELERSTLLALAETDPLTGLPNRRGLGRRFDEWLPTVSTRSQLGVYLLDLDGFKPVNDRLGHDAGDELLVQVARRLQQVARPSDVVARLGGDEFVLLVPGLPDDAAAQAVAQQLLQAFASPFDVRGHPCRVGATIGLATAPADGQTRTELLRRADAAMYAGKQAGGQRVRRDAAGPGLTAAAERPRQSAPPAPPGPREPAADAVR